MLTFKSYIVQYSLICLWLHFKFLFLTYKNYCGENCEIRLAADGVHVNEMIISTFIAHYRVIRKHSRNLVPPKLC